MTRRRIAITSLTAVAALAVAGCGGSSGQASTLSKQDQEQLAQRTSQLQQSLQTTAADLTKCVQGSIKSGGIAALSDCADRILTKAGNSAQDLSNYATNLKGKVKDKCGAELQAMASAVKEVASSLKTAGTAIGKGDVARFQSAIGGLSTAGNRLQGAVTATGNACAGANPTGTNPAGVSSTQK